MRVSVAVCAGLLGGVAQGHSNSRWIKKRQDSDTTIDYPPVAGYNFTIPVDHFDSSNSATYNNRYWVNDTYYKPGGPVILYDNGEAALDPQTLSVILSEFNGTSSAPLRLASELNGLVIGWEHRYYGYSRPVDMDDLTGLPVAGASGYEYLTVDQALEDVAYFANNFNKTTLDLNEVVQQTTTLDPYHTPWIFMGGSYPGLRAALSRLKHPEVWYAAWSSSAPVQVQPDGSIYFNPVVRSMPSNCTNDVLAAIKYVDDTLTNGSAEAIAQINAAVYYITPLASSETLEDALSWDPFVVGELLESDLVGSFQNLGPQHTTQLMCDFMESFDTTEFLSSISTASTISEMSVVLLNNSGDGTPTDGGIAASNEDSGELAFAAFMFGLYNGAAATEAYIETISGPQTPPYPTEDADTLSWLWQSISEVGYYQGSNASHDYRVVSKFFNTTAARDISIEQQAFAAFPSSSFPAQPNNSYLLAYGGWNIKATNTLFSNGEFDPWRAFSAASQEVDDGAPNRTVTQTIPACNALPEGDDVFGIVYPGAVHAEDIFSSIYSRKGDTESVTPLQQGLELFVKAYNTWQPCFNQSRDAVRTGNSPPGSGGSSNSSSSSSNKPNAAAQTINGVKASTALFVAITTVMLAFL